ncbi:MAG: hypothetical protein HZA31_08070 [Opitutae bacterium]|nr:hypothetical protein [Opitutae bacterium]
MNAPSDPLARVLASWQVAPPSDPQFRTAVWARLRTVREQRWAAYLRQHAFASTAALAVAVVTGGWLGQWQAQRQAARDREALTVAYLQGIDARYAANATATSNPAPSAHQHH